MMSRCRIVVDGVLTDELVIELTDADIGLVAVSPSGRSSHAATTVLVAELTSPEEFVRLLESFQQLGLGLTSFRVTDDG